MKSTRTLTAPRRGAATRSPVDDELAYRLGAIMECLDETVAIFDVDDRPVYANRPVEGVFGPEALSRLAALREEVARTATPAEVEHSFNAPDGPRHFHVIKHPYWAPDGSRAGTITIRRDITGRRLMETALQAQNEQLRTLDLMKTDFVNTVSHELRTPLTSIVAYAEFLEDGIGGPMTDPQLEYLGHVLEGARHLQRLVDDLLDFACCGGRTLRLRFEEADLRTRAAEVVEGLRPQAAQRDITLQLELPTAPVCLTMDEGRIGQVLINLVGNALKFTPVGGTVTLRLRPDADGGAIAEVVDDGIGIAERDMPYLFERFYQVDNSTTRTQGGAGLGLYICRTIVEAHGGALAVESAFGEGSRFWITLPNAPPTAEVAPA
jgi:signal transduction histidine kinase